MNKFIPSGKTRIELILEARAKLKSETEHVKTLQVLASKGSLRKQATSAEKHGFIDLSIALDNKAYSSEKTRVRPSLVNRPYYKRQLP